MVGRQEGQERKKEKREKERKEGSRKGGSENGGFSDGSSRTGPVLFGEWHSCPPPHAVRALSALLPPRSQKP